MGQPKDSYGPWLAKGLLTRLIPSHFHEEFLGDLKEIHEVRKREKGRTFAAIAYWLDVIHLIWGFGSLPRLLPSTDGTMLRHYFLVAARQIHRNRLYSTINILSLAVGMGVCLLIGQYIYTELSYDRFHPGHEQLFRVIIEETQTDLQETSPYVGYNFGAAAQEVLPEVTAYMRKEGFNRGAVVINPEKGRTYHEDVYDLLFVDASFFDLFHFEWKEGNAQTVFPHAQSLVITEKTAKRYFGTENPVGKTLTINAPPSPGDYIVSGIIQTPPLNTHLQFDFLLPMENYLEKGWGGAVKKQGGWKGFSVVTYLQIKKGADLEIVSKKLTQLLANHNDERTKGRVILQPVADIYLKSGQYSDAGMLKSTGNLPNIRIFFLISLFILFIAWANYVNLSTAQSLQRIKEVGVRKSLGAHRKQLISQFLVESFSLNLISGFAAIGLAHALLPGLSDIIGKELSFSLLHLPAFWFLFLLVISLGSLLSGMYPAFVLSKFQPHKMIKAGKSGNRSMPTLRRGLIAFQFAASLLLLSGTYLVYKQTIFLRGQELSTKLEQVLILRSQQQGEDNEKIKANFQAFRTELVRNHAVSALTSSVWIPGQYGVSAFRRKGTPEDEAPYSRSIFAGVGFSQVYSLSFLAGGPFTDQMEEEEVVIINASALASYGFGQPQDAIQQKLTIGSRDKTIVGVVEDFDWHSRKEAHLPYVIALTNVQMNPFLSLQMSLGNTKATLSHIEQTFERFFPDQPFEYFFAEEEFDRLYQSEVQFGKIFLTFAALAIFIAAVGLFAMISYTTNLRVKEIGIRKVLGANVFQLIPILIKEYIWLMGIAALLSIPLVIGLGNQWLETYATRVQMGWDTLILPLFMLLLIALITAGNKTLATARANPADSLRKE